MGNINSKIQARKRVREAQVKATEARVERERKNVDDAASLLVELGRLAAVDEWERNRVQEVHAEAERRRYDHRQAGAAAVQRMQGRGESLAAIAELADLKVGHVRAVLKAASARPAARSDALGAVTGASGGAQGAAENGAATEGSSAVDPVDAEQSGALGSAAEAVSAAPVNGVGGAS